MPWTWTSPTGNPNLDVLKEQPGQLIPFDLGVKECTAGGKWYYFCPECDGWIEGHAIEKKEDTLAPLAGRRGTVSYCRRCAKQIAFFGVVS